VYSICYCYKWWTSKKRCSSLGWTEYWMGIWI